MATKNLARTVIEGGRRRYNKFDRHYSNRQLRRKERAYARRSLFDSDAADAHVVARRRKVWREHNDKLGPAERWLASFVGRPYAEVRAAMASRFDIRTIAGQHIVFDHLLPSIRGSGHDVYSRPDFEIDENGCLRRVRE